MAAKSLVEDPVLAEMSYDVQFAFRAGQEDNNSLRQFFEYHNTALDSGKEDCSSIGQWPLYTLYMLIWYAYMTILLCKINFTCTFYFSFCYLHEKSDKEIFLAQLIGNL